MNRKEIETTVHCMLRDVIDGLDIVQPSKKPIITNQSILQNDLGLDSLALAELAVRIEMKFNLDVFENSIPLTVEDVINELGVSS